MRHWKPFMSTAGVVLVASLMALVAVGCKKSEPAPADPVEDTTLVLPEPPGLDSLDDAFAEDDFAGETTAVVEAEPQKSAPQKPPAPRQGIVKDGAYTLQVGIYSTKAAAINRSDALIRQGYPAYVSHVRDPKPDMPGTYYRVRIGTFHTTAAARAYGATNLAPAGIKYWADLSGRDTQPVTPVYRPRPPEPAPVPAPATTPTRQAPPAPPVTSAPPAPTPSPAPAAAESMPTPAPPPAPAEDTAPASDLPDW